VAAALNQAWRWTATKKPGRNEGRRLTAEDLAKVWLDDAGRCRYCDIDIPLMTASFDHVVPLSKQGPHLPQNLAACCITCQRSKYTKTSDAYQEFMRLQVVCPCGTVFRPRWADWVRGYGHYCSRSCSGRAGGGLS